MTLWIVDDIADSAFGCLSLVLSLIRLVPVLSQGRTGSTLYSLHFPRWGSGGECCPISVSFARPLLPKAAKCRLGGWLPWGTAGRPVGKIRHAGGHGAQHSKGSACLPCVRCAYQYLRRNLVRSEFPSSYFCIFVQIDAHRCIIYNN
jgi:hypothetical protein